MGTLTALAQTGKARAPRARLGWERKSERATMLHRGRIGRCVRSLSGLRLKHFVSNEQCGYKKELTASIGLLLQGSQVQIWAPGE